MTPQDFIREAYARALALVGNWWPLGIAIGAVILLVVGYRKSAVRIPWRQLGSIALCVLIGSLAACWMIFGIIALAPVALLVAVIFGLIVAFAHLFKWLNGRKQRADLPGPWLRERMSGVLTADEKRRLLAWAEEHQDMPEEELLDDRQIAYLSYVRHWSGVKEDTALMWGEVFSSKEE